MWISTNTLVLERERERERERWMCGSVDRYTHIHVYYFSYFYYYSVCWVALSLNVHVHVFCNSRSNSTSAAPTQLEQAYNYASTQESPMYCVHTLSIRCLLTWQLSGFVVLYWNSWLAFVLPHDCRKMHCNMLNIERVYLSRCAYTKCWVCQFYYSICWVALSLSLSLSLLINSW